MQTWIGTVKTPASKLYVQPFEVQASNLTTAVTRLLRMALPEYAGRYKAKALPKAQTITIQIQRVR